MQTYFLIYYYYYYYAIIIQYFIIMKEMDFIMKLIIKYLSKYKILLLISLGFIILQVTTSLKIPEYMSDMVNVGIQNGGVSKSSPRIMSKAIFDIYRKFDVNIENSYTKEKDFYVKKNDEFSENFDIISQKIFSIINKEIRLNSISDIKNIKNEEVEKVIKDINIYEKYDNKFDRSAIFINLINEKMIGNNIFDIQMKYIIGVSIKMLVTTFILVFAIIGSGHIAVRISSGVARDLRNDVFSKIMGFSAENYKKINTASLITRCTKDIESIRSLLLSLIRKFIYSIIISIGAIIITMKKSYTMSLIIFSFVILVIIIFLLFLKKTIGTIEIFFDNLDKLNNITRENVMGIMDIRAFNNQNFERERFDKINSYQKEKDSLLYILFGTQSLTIDFALNIGILTIILLGANLIETSKIMVGDLIATIEYITYVVFSVIEAMYVISSIPRMLISTNRLEVIFNTKNSMLQESEIEICPSGDIEFKNVSFSYDEEPVLKDISFSIKKGEKFALVGTTGAGKSTLIKLLMREYDVDEGEILLDGVNIKNIKKSNLVKAISYAPQKSILLKGSIRDNIKFGDVVAKDEDIDKMLKLTDSYDFVYDKKGLDTDISQEAKNLSGGQKQRLSMARAVLKKANTYIFDDCFSALDVSTDELVRNNIFNKILGKTVIIVGQRISSIRDADKILVLDEGEAVGLGNHDSLKKDCEVYKFILDSQRGIYDE